MPYPSSLSFAKGFRLIGPFSASKEPPAETYFSCFCIPTFPTVNILNPWELFTVPPAKTIVPQAKTLCHNTRHGATIEDIVPHEMTNIYFLTYMFMDLQYYIKSYKII